MRMAGGAVASPWASATIVTPPPTSNRRLRTSELDGVSELAAHHLGESRVEIVAVAVVGPGIAGLVPVVVPGAVDRREPHLLGRTLPVQDEPGAVRELEGHPAVARRVVDLFRIEGLDPGRDLLQAILRAGLVVRHRSGAD